MLGMLNSRMKDYFDLWALSRLYSFEGPTLVSAIKATFARRNMMIESHPAGLRDEFAEEKSVQWTAFIHRSRLATAPTRFAEIILAVRNFAHPLLSAATSGRSVQSNLACWRTVVCLTHRPKSRSFDPIPRLHRTAPSDRPRPQRSAAAVETASPFCLVVPLVPSAMLSWDFVRDRAIRDLQIENPIRAILIGWFVGPENCGSPASRSWHFQSLPVARPKLASLLSSRPSFVIR